MFTTRIQVALFFDSIVDRPDKYINDLNSALGNIFDTIPVMLPIPDDAPFDFPLLSLSSSSKYYGFQITRRRADIFLNIEDLSADGNSKAISFRNHILQFISFFIQKYPINRIGLVSTTIVPSVNPIEVVNKKYVSKKLGDLTELSIRYNNRVAKFSMSFNDITDIQCGNYIQKGITTPAVVISKDINNVPNDSLTLSKKTLNDILDHFYPTILASGVKGLI